MAPSYVSRGSDLDEDLTALLMERTRGNPAKPWTIVSDVANETDENPETVRETLRQLTLQGTLTPNADGDLRVAEALTHG